MAGVPILKMYRDWKDKRPERPIFRTILVSMLAVLLVEIVLMTASIWMTDVPGQLDQNAKDILEMQVHNRASYLSDLLVQAQDLAELSDTINQTAQALLDQGVISPDTLENGTTESDPLLQAIAPELVDTLRSKAVTGIFVVLNTDDLRTKDVGSPLPGIYLRDLDPDARPSERNADLMVERGSASVVKALGITTDKSWEPVISYQGFSGKGFLKAPFQEAYDGQAALKAEDYGRWTTSTYTLVNDDRTAIAYSRPLILPDGTVYGVVGVEILTSYLESKLPYSELQSGETGSYFLVSSLDDPDAEELSLRKSVTSSGDDAARANPNAVLRCTRNSGGSWLQLNRKKYYAALEPLVLYSRNAPFCEEHWILVGAVESGTLFAFSGTVQRVLLMAILITLILGIVSSLVVSRTLAHPTEQLYREVIEAQRTRTFPRLSHTGIRELDRFAEAITQLNSSLITSSTKFLRIMDMASVELGGYELRYDTGSVFVTENFFALLGEPEVNPDTLSVRRFEEILNRIQCAHPCRRTAEGDKLLTIRQDGVTCYIMLRVTNENHVQVGLAEDVTATTLERMRIEHERDYDILTGLYNRQAFHRVYEELFAEPERLGVAALLMMDLDNLKHINDTYGHDWGDQYIHRTGQCIAANTPTGTVCARLSGDEFLLLFYGYRSKEQVREKIQVLGRAMQQSVAVLPSGSELRISISGGIAWYPEDGRELEMLKRYADFAMYQVKHSTKGRVQEFSIEVYDQEAYAARTRREFQQLISEERVQYVLQPIFSARTGEVHAYEALMCSDLPTLRSPATIMKLAREQGALYEIERLTMFKASEHFVELQQKGHVRRDALLFVNSMASVCMTAADEQRYAERYPKLMQQLVVEITEEEEIDHTALEQKRRVKGFSGIFALDDYGSGYSNEGSLLSLEPRYIKVDLAIIRDIDTDPDKQQIVRNIVAYAHPRGMKIIAEGVETAAELQMVLELDVDALQGYLLARPGSIPAPIAPEAAEIIRSVNARKKD